MQSREHGSIDIPVKSIITGSLIGVGVILLMMINAPSLSRIYMSVIAGAVLMGAGLLAYTKRGGRGLMVEKKVLVKTKASKKEDTYQYSGWLNSDKFMKRAFAVMGYGITATFIVYLGTFLLMGMLYRIGG